MKLTDLPQWQKLVTLLRQCLSDGADGHHLADFLVSEVQLEGGKFSSSRGGSLSTLDAEAYEADRPFPEDCDGVDDANRAFFEAAAASGVSLWMMRIVFECKSGKWEVARTTFQTTQERAAFISERAPYEEPLKQALLKIPTGPWHEIVADWRNDVSESQKFVGFWRSKGEPVSRFEEQTPELRATYEAARGVYERHGYELVLFKFKLAGGPKHAQIEVNDFYG